jgi:gas vesicle protein
MIVSAWTLDPASVFVGVAIGLIVSAVAAALFSD